MTSYDLCLKQFLLFCGLRTMGVRAGKGGSGKMGEAQRRDDGSWK